MSYDKKKIEEIGLFENIEQTFLAWIQTSLTLIGFGFGVGSIIAFMESHHYEKIMVKAIRIIGELLIIIGVFAIIFALIHHRIKVKSFDKQYKYLHISNLPLVIGGMIGFLGLVSFFAFLIHMILTWA